MTGEAGVVEIGLAAVDGPASYGPLGRLGWWTAHHFRAVLLTWAVIAVGLGVFAPRAQHALAGAGWAASGSQSVSARHLIDLEFGGLSRAALQVVVHAPQRSVTDPAVGSVVTRADHLLR